MGGVGALHAVIGHPGGTKPPETRLRRCVRIMLPCHLPAALPHPNIPPNKRPIIDSPPAARAKRPVARAATKRIGWSRLAFTPSRHRLLTTIDYTRDPLNKSREPARHGTECRTRRHLLSIAALLTANGNAVMRPLRGCDGRGDLFRGSLDTRPAESARAANPPHPGILQLPAVSAAPPSS